MTNATSELAGVVGRFQLGRRLGAGAFGTVYEAEDVGNNQRIALKQLHVLDGDALYRFKQEFRSAADIVHPNLVALKELFAANGNWYMTMEFIDGVDFRVWVRGDSAPVMSLADDQRATHKWAPNSNPDGTIASDSASPHYDETRLRTALTQLVAAVHELHRHNVLHRDLKPSNVMISSDQRLRVLDYGLAAPIGPGGLHASLDEFVVGTPAYMSPEQAEGLAVSTASDWYAVGVMLFEVLTGRLPFEGTAREVLWKKVHEDGPDPRTFDRELPDDLASLCRALLARDPLHRPQHAELAALVGALSRESNPVLGDVLGSDVFVGRAAELGALRTAAGRLRGTPSTGVVVHVQGPSGVGKSSLVRRFLEDVEAPSIVLAGRCYERESVPFKALDSLVDTLTQYLRGLSPPQVEALLPKHAAALARVFPVLSRLEAFAGARILDRVTDPNEVRRRAGLALRELLDTLAKRQQLILWIDDLQWGDADSAVLFRELVAPPDPPPMMLVLSYRSEDAAAEMVAAVRGRRLAGANAVVELAIEPLPAGEAEQLASTLLGDNGIRKSGAKRDHAKRIANDSGGIPFFVHELARTVTAGQPLGLSLADVIAHRIAALDEAPRRLLDVVAAAGGPIDHRVARTAANTGLDELILLRAAHFLRSRGGDGNDDLVECFHDRVRETALEYMVNRAEIHRRIATALERETTVDPEALVAHFRAAGDDERTLHYAERAAELAEQKLAFDRAADLYELAMSLAPAAQRQTFAVRFAEALANAGRGVEAARAFRTAADGATGEQAVRLRTRAAEQFLRSGHLDDGVAQLEPALAHMSLRLPHTASSALVTLLARRARLKLRGLGFTERTADQLSSSDLHRIDLCWSVGNGLGGVDMIRAATFQAQHLLLALNAGEPYRVSRAIAWESIVRAMEGGPNGRRRASELGTTAKNIAERIDHPHARAWAAATDAIAAECEGRWREAQAHSLVTIALFREAQTDVAWEVGSMYAWWLLPALYFAGDLSELSFQAPDRVEEVDRVGDLYTATSMRTYVLPLVHLVAGDPDRAEAETRNAIDKWSRSGWHLQHWCDLKSRAEIALYRGDGVAALAAWDAEQKALAKSLLMRMTMVGVQTRFSLGRALIAAAEQRGGDAACIARATKVRAALAKIDTGWAQQFARTLAAGIAQLSGDRTGAVAALAEAAAGYRGIDMGLHAAAAELVRAKLTGGDAAPAEAELRAQDVADPHALAAALVPGFARTPG